MRSRLNSGGWTPKNGLFVIPHKRQLPAAGKFEELLKKHLQIPEKKRGSMADYLRDHFQFEYKIDQKLGGIPKKPPHMVNKPAIAYLADAYRRNRRPMEISLAITLLHNAVKELKLVQGLQQGTQVRKFIEECEEAIEDLEGNKKRNSDTAILEDTPFHFFKELLWNEVRAMNKNAGKPDMRLEKYIKKISREMEALAERYASGGNSHQQGI